MSEPLSSITVDEKKTNESSVVYIIIFLIVAAVFVFILIKDELTEQESQNVSIDVSVPEITQVEHLEPEITLPEKLLVEPITENVQVESTEVIEEKIQLPSLDDSDLFIGQIITEISWRKELLSLILTDDVVRRIVVTADNFAQGELAYSHIPLRPPVGKFSAEKSTQTIDEYKILETNHQRYTTFIELLDSFEPETLAIRYNEIKPLFESAYAELGYPDKSFDDVVKSCIDRVLDMPVPVSSPILIRPNVMFEYQDNNLEQLNAADKLLLRIGKENLLQLKAFALTLDNQLNSIQ